MAGYLPREGTRFERLIPSDSIIYMSYVFGTDDERAQLTILSSEEIKNRIRILKANGGDFIKVTKPENKPAYDKFVLDVLAAIQNRAGVLKEPPKFETN